MEKLLHLYKYVDGVNDSPFPSKEQQATLYEFKYDAKRMGNAPTITGTLMHPLCLDELWGNNEVYVSYNGERYFIKQTPTSSYSNDDTRYKHECDFVSERVLLNDVYFYDVVTSDVSNDKPVSNSSNVVFYGDIHELAKRLNYSLQYAKLEYSVVVDEGITSESKLVSFQKQFFANVLQEGYKLFEIPYYFEGGVIHFGYTNNTIDKLFSYGAKDALLSISKNNITQRIVNRITGVGSADNIPYYYPNFDPKGVSEVLYNGKANNLVSVENLIKYKKVKLGDTFIYNYESDKVVEYVDKSKYVVSKDITLLSENHETTKRYELVLDFPFSVDIAPQSSIVELDYSKTFLTKFKARLYRNLELRDTFTSFGEIPYYRLIEGEYNFSISLEFTFGEFDEKTELTESDIPSIVDALTISITSDVSGFEQWTLNTANNIVKLSDYGLKLNTSPKNGDKITFKQLSYIPPQPNLMPPIYRETLGAERFYNALNNTYYDRIMGSYYSFDNLFMVGKNKEDDVLFEDIKPSIKGVTNSYYERIDVFSEFAWDENDNDEFDEEGNYLHPYFFGKLRLFDGEFGFNLFDHAIEEDEMVISMTSGSCGGCNFIIGVDDESQKNIVQVDENGNLKRDANGNVLYGSPQERQNDTSKYEVWVALKKDIETFGVIMPNATNNYRPSAGDTFVILHIDLPNAYILAAEERLREELIKYMKENNSEKFNFSLSFSRIFFAENPTILAQLNENARIKIAYNNNAYTLYVSSYSYSMNADTALPEIRVELSEELAIVKESIVKQLANASLYLNKEVQRVNTSVATTNTTISKNTATAQASITKTNARVENVEKVVMNLQSNSGGGGGQGGINEEQLENYLTTNQYAKKSDIPSLDAYAKSDDVANTYATKSALKGVSDSVSTLREDFDNLNTLLNGNVDGVIDTWNEVVSFLDGYSQSDDLATILSGMNTDIANRVLIEDFEKLEEAVNPLFGYFDATGNANNALKLGGQLPSYYAPQSSLDTTNANITSLTQKLSTIESGVATNKTNIATLTTNLSDLTGRVDVAEDALKTYGDSIAKNAADIAANAKAIGVNETAILQLGERVDKLEGYWYIDDDGNLHTTYSIVVDKGGAFGKGSGGGGDVPSGGGGIDETQLWNILGASGSQTIHSSHIPDLSGKYLSVSGGTIQSTTWNPFIINTTYSSLGLYLHINSINKAGLVYNVENGASLYNATKAAYLGIKDDGTPHYNGNTLIHSGNYSSYALPLSGGTLTGSNAVVLRLDTTHDTQNAFLLLHKGVTKTQLGYVAGAGSYMYDYTAGTHLGIDTNGAAYCGTSTDVSSNNHHLLIHSGNIGSQSVDKATKIVNSDGIVMAQGDVYGLAISGSSSKAKYLLLSRASKNDGGIIFQEAGDNKWQIVDSGGALTFYNYTTRKSEVYMAASGNILLGTTSDSAAKLRIQTGRTDTFTWSLGNLASKSDMALEFYQDNSNIYGLYTAINYSTGDVAMQVGRSDGGTSAYNLILNPLGGNVLIGTKTNISWADLNVNGPIATKDYVSFYRSGEKGYVGCGAESTDDVYLSASTNNLRLFSKGFTAIRGGNVVIGKETESSYGYKLDIYQDANKDYDFHVFNNATKSSFFVGKSSLWYGTSLTGDIQIFSIASGCTYDGGGGTSVLSAKANGIVEVPTRLNVSNINGYTPITSGNIALQSVSYADSSGYSDRLLSPYTYEGGTYISNDTSAESIFGSSYAFSAMMEGCTVFNNFATVFNFSGYKHWGATQLAANYNASNTSKPRLALRNYNQSISGWTDWVEFITSANITSQSVTYATNATRLYASDEPYRYGDSSPYYLKMRYNVLGDNSWYLSVYPESPANVSVDRARKLVTSRGIFGNSFDGTADIPVTAVGHMRYLLFKDAAGTTNVGYIGRGGSTNAMELQTYGNYSLLLGAYSKNILTLAPSGAVIIGSTTDYSQRLQINGNIRFIAEADCEIGNAYSLTDTNAYNRIIIGNGSTGLKYCSGRWTSSNVISHSFCVGLHDTPAVTINNIGYLGVNIGNAAYHLDVAGNVRTHSIGIANEDGTGRGISLYRSPDYVDMYGIHFSVTSKFGTHGSVTGSWATYFTTSENNYGWIFRNSSVSNVASISGVGNLTCNGGGAFGSDIRYKDIISYRQLDIETIVNAPLFSFRWTDREDKVEHLGTSAQYWLDTQFKDAVNITNPEFFHLDYGALAVGIGISVAREVKGVKTEVQTLKEELSQVKKELKYYKELWQHSEQA